MDNIRTISLIHIGGKILEKALSKILTSYLKNHSISSDKQYGFNGGKSTSDCIGKFGHDVLYNLNTNAITCTVFIDSSKVFDFVNHSILIDKLKSMVLTPYGFLVIYLVGPNVLNLPILCHLSVILTAVCRRALSWGPPYSMCI